MKHRGLLAFLPIVLLGCGSSAPENDPSKAAVVAAPPVTVAAPGSTGPTSVGLYRKGKEVHVGADPEDAVKALRAGATGGFTSEALPPGFTAPYQSIVWQAGDSGVGVIAYEGKTVMAMLQENNSTADHLTEVRNAQQGLVDPKTTPTMIEGKNVTYWFWHDVYHSGGDDHPQTMMVMAFQKPGGKVYIVSAMGDDVVMSALGITEELARQDLIKADSIIQAREARKPAAPAPSAATSGTPIPPTQ